LLQESDSVCQKLNVFLGALTGNTLLSEGRTDGAVKVLTFLTFVSLLLFLILLTSIFLARVLFYLFCSVV